MTHIGYDAETITISVDGENFNVTNLTPKISDSERREVKTLIQKKLYNVFQENTSKVNKSKRDDGII